MINIYVKAGTLKGNSIISLILKSQKHQWTKALKIDQDLPNNSFTKSVTLDALAVLYALKHVKDNYRKKKVTVHSDSAHIASALKTRRGEYINKTKMTAIEFLRDVVGTFNNISINKFPSKCKYKDELEHIFVECALDQIEIDEKD